MELLWQWSLTFYNSPDAAMSREFIISVLIFKTFKLIMFKDQTSWDGCFFFTLYVPQDRLQIFIQSLKVDGRIINHRLTALTFHHGCIEKRQSN